MTTPLSKEETAILIRAKRIQKEKNIPKGASISSICSIAGIARKTGYQWEEALQKKLSVTSTVSADIDTEHKELKKELQRVKFENEGLHLAWEIHDVDRILAKKKDITKKNRRIRR